MDVLGLFAGELKQRPNSIVVPGKLQPGVIDDVGKNKFLDQSEHRQILVAADPIESSLLLR